MKSVDIAQATAPLADYAQEAAGETLVVTAGGEPIAALVPIHNADLETVRLSDDPRFIALIERSRAQQKSEGGISSAEMRRRLGAD
ncbi:hypothetical protein HYR69_03935 [Candidatus Sumerlaeota bacterium]|nr:hypothetical protein [Candidatus Sumerlaeota bacterium]